jgi:DNA-directed RNA polymerase subunit RPC12/RpoP
MTKICSICKKEFAGNDVASVYAEAGEWLAEEVWQDSGLLCPRCLENRALLVMMYGHDCNT